MLLRFLAPCVLVSAALGQSLVANFDELVEGQGGTSLSSGGIVFTNLVPNFAGGPGEFFVDRSPATGPFGGYTAPNVLAFGTFGHGDATAYGNCKEFDIVPPSRGRSATIWVFELGNDPATNTCSLEAFSNGVLVASTSFAFVGGGPFLVTPHQLTLANVSFDRLRLRNHGTNGGGVSFITIDSVEIELEAAPSAFVTCSGDGQVQACPCGNASPTGAGEGCSNSLGVGATLRAGGVASVAADSLLLAGAQMPNSTALYFQGSSVARQGGAAPFGDGLRCVGGTLVRLGAKLNHAGGSVHPGTSDAGIATAGAVTAGSTLGYQVWYRNAASFCTPSLFNLSNALVVTWQP